jgi:chloride channel protein, CIC family
MRATTEVLPSQFSIFEALELVNSSTLRAWPVTDRRGVIGIVSLPTLEGACAEGIVAAGLGGLVDACAFPHVHADQPLDLALERMGAAHIDLLPVVSRAAMNKLEDVITLRDLLASFGIDVSDEQSSLAERLGAETRIPLGSPCSEGSKTDLHR